MSTSTSTELVDFALRTADTAWIKRHGGRTDGKGRVIVQVPAGEISAVTFAGNDMLRHRFADCPKDSAREVMCPAKYVPDTAALFAFQSETGKVSPAVAEFMRRTGKR